MKKKEKRHEHFVSPLVTTFGRPKNVKSHVYCSCLYTVDAGKREEVEGRTEDEKDGEGDERGGKGKRKGQGMFWA